jgi:hypothetical protein
MIDDFNIEWLTRHAIHQYSSLKETVNQSGNCSRMCDRTGIYLTMLSLSVCIHLRCNCKCALRILFYWNMTIDTWIPTFQTNTVSFFKSCQVPEESIWYITHYVPSKCFDPITHWHIAISQKNRTLNHTAGKTSKLGAFTDKTELMALDWMPESVKKDWKSTGMITGVKCCLHSHILFRLLKR